MESLLFLSHRLPYPPNKGDKVRSYHLLRHLVRRYRVVLGTFVDDPADWQHVPAVKRLCAEVRDGRLDPESIDEALLSGRLYTAGQPDPDLLIRTSGELRVSNFLLWQIAYSEIWVTDVLWPDFRRRHLLQAILDFQKRERRYGGIVPA